MDLKTNTARCRFVYRARHAPFLLLLLITCATTVLAVDPGVKLIAAPCEKLAGIVDCNSPVELGLVPGEGKRIFMSASDDGCHARTEGLTIQHFQICQEQPCARWLESTHVNPLLPPKILYGWYHEEVTVPACGGPATICCTGAGAGKDYPRIGAAKSFDGGATWIDLGPVLDHVDQSADLNCDSENEYFVGGFGDLTVLPDQSNQYIYFLFSSYVPDFTKQGIAIARMKYSDLDNPVDKVWIWTGTGWNAPGRGGSPKPIKYATADVHSCCADLHWGPSVHWNTYLNSYVMFVNHAVTRFWANEGHYVAFNPNIANPDGWTGLTPVCRSPDPPNDYRLYPEVIGCGERETDKLAGQFGRFYVNGGSRWRIQFLRPDENVVQDPVPWCHDDTANSNCSASCGTRSLQSCTPPVSCCTGAAPCGVIQQPSPQCSAACTPCCNCNPPITCVLLGCDAALPNQCTPSECPP